MSNGCKCDPRWCDECGSPITPGAEVAALTAERDALRAAKDEAYQQNAILRDCLRDQGALRLQTIKRMRVALEATRGTIRTCFVSTWADNVVAVIDAALSQPADEKGGGDGT